MNMQIIDYHVPNVDDNKYIIINLESILCHDMLVTFIYRF